MTDVIDINSHMARTCGCGCVTFNLLRNGAIECAGCGEKQARLYWSENMNSNYQASEQIEFSDETINQGKAIIRAAITKNQQCFWPDIVTESEGVLQHEVLLEASRQMQRDKEIRLREDSYEHAMEYILL